MFARPHTPRMKLVALAAFVVFATLLVGGVVWAGEDADAQARSLAWCTGVGSWTLRSRDGTIVARSHSAAKRTCSTATIEGGRCILTVPGLDLVAAAAFEHEVEQAAGDRCPNGIEFRDG
jgi:hypothetical protein